MGRFFIVLLLFLSPIAGLAQDVRLAKIIEVQSGDSAVTRQFFGHVVAKETVDLAFQVGGQIVELPVIEGARIDAKKEDRAIRDGEVVTACQAACPTGAIVFGDVSDPASAVSARKAGGRDYDLLPDANTRPRTTYQARIRKGETA